jgi:hypothetical protein
MDTSSAIDLGRLDSKVDVILEGPPVSASWSEALTAEMKHRGRAVHEEHVLSGLIEDLRQG